MACMTSTVQRGRHRSDRKIAVVHCRIDVAGALSGKPHTGEFIETKGGNHKGLKAWKVQYGAETFESWLN